MTILGIDLGTTNTCAAVYKDGTPLMIFDKLNGAHLIPSYVAFNGGEWMHGPIAKDFELMDPHNTIFEAKRLIGRRFKEPEVVSQLEQRPFKIVERNGLPHVSVSDGAENRIYSSEEIQSKLLRYVVECAESQLGILCKDVVISVPAYFSTDQRAATKRAAELADLNVRRLIHEPTAAAIAYAWESKNTSPRNVLVYDLGGGTFDVSILHIDGSRSFKVLAINGDCNLGGHDFDRRLVNKFITQLGTPKATTNNMAMLRRKCEVAKIMLTGNNLVSVFLTEAYGPELAQQKVKRTNFDELNKDLFGKTIEIVHQALLDAGLEKHQIDEVLLVGGSSRIPKLQELLRTYFERDCLKKSRIPEEVVAKGAAILAGTLEPNCEQELRDFALLEKTPRTIGIGLLGGYVEPISKRNTLIPVAREYHIGTVSDNQATMDIRVYEGERFLQKDNNIIGQFPLSQFHAANRGEVTFTMNFVVDESGCLTVSAFEEKSGVRNQIQIERKQQCHGVSRTVFGPEGHKEIDNQHRKRYIDWRDAYDTVFKLKRKIESVPEIQNQTDLLGKCDELALWFRINELAEDIDWRPRLAELCELCEPYLSTGKIRSDQL